MWLFTNKKDATVPSRGPTLTRASVMTAIITIVTVRALGSGLVRGTITPKTSSAMAYRGRPKHDSHHPRYLAASWLSMAFPAVGLPTVALLAVPSKRAPQPTSNLAASANWLAGLPAPAIRVLTDGQPSVIVRALGPSRGRHRRRGCADGAKPPCPSS
jgi:hypothetical protein